MTTATSKGDLPCIPWLGRGVEYQHAARDVMADRLVGRPDSPWVYIAPDCSTKMCLQEFHLRWYRSQKIAYPAYVCVYCGMPGFTKDHLLPVTFTGDAARRFVAVVPACGECNSGIGDRCGHRITERRAEAHKVIRKKHRKTLEAGKRWTPAELAQLGPNLRAAVKGSLIKREVLLERLEWPHDPDYDRRAFEKSGFEDPIAMELI